MKDLFDRRGEPNLDLLNHQLHLLEWSSEVRLPEGTPVTYYGCRACSQSKDFLEWSGKIVAVLDSNMMQERVQQDSVLRVNGRLHQSLFDFDWVEVMQATDEEVEKFAVQVGNDTDAVRQPRYKKMRCVIAQDCKLSKNTLRILRSRFWRVEYGD